MSPDPSSSTRMPDDRSSWRGRSNSRLQAQQSADERPPQVESTPLPRVAVTRLLSHIGFAPRPEKLRVTPVERDAELTDEEGRTGARPWESWGTGAAFGAGTYYPQELQARAHHPDGVAHPLPKTCPTRVGSQRLTGTSGEGRSLNSGPLFSTLACKTADRFKDSSRRLAGFESRPLRCNVGIALVSLSGRAARSATVGLRLEARGPHVITVRGDLGQVLRT